MIRKNDTIMTTEKRDAETMKKIRKAVESGYDVSVKSGGKDGGIKILKYKPQTLETIE